MNMMLAKGGRDQSLHLSFELPIAMAKDNCDLYCCDRHDLKNSKAGASC